MAFANDAPQDAIQGTIQSAEHGKMQSAEHGKMQSAEHGKMQSAMHPTAHWSDAREAQPGLTEVETVGRVVFSEDRPPDELRRMALSDALYLAALHGAAEIRGFSAVDGATHLQEHVVVQPRGHVVDYTIIEENRVQDHYEIRIRAVIGNAENASANCHSQAPRTITIFKPMIFVDPNLPAWVMPAIGKSLSQALQDIRGHTQINMKLALSSELKPEQIRKQKADMNYASLMASTRIEPGDYAMVPEISMTAMRERRFGLADVSHAQISLRLALYQGPDLVPVIANGGEMQAIQGISHQSTIRLHSFWDNIDLLINRHKDQHIASLVAGLESGSLHAVDGLACQPIQSQLARQDNQFYVPIGSRHGVEDRQLGVIPASDGGWVVARVSRLEADRAVLEPLDVRKSLAPFVGSNIRFMETH